ncbi:hypothetical protein ACWEP8_26835 [Streptomyces hydrogenans]
MPFSGSATAARRTTVWGPPTDGPRGGPRSDATLRAHTDDGTLGNARELHAEQQARRSA